MKIIEITNRSNSNVYDVTYENGSHTSLIADDIEMLPSKFLKFINSNKTDLFVFKQNNINNYCWYR